MFRVYHRLGEDPSEARPSAVCIGNFDGVHAGHRRILRRAAQLGHQRGWVPSVLTFEPHPTKIVAPQRAPRLLNSTEQKIELLHEAGIEQVFVLTFDRNFSQMLPVEFVKKVLVDGVKAAAVLVGENFHFGSKQSGNVDTLRQLGHQFGFQTEVVSSVSCRGRVVSSSEVRSLVESGNVGLAARLLERPFWIEGEVVKGHGIGSKQTVPTLNLATTAEVLPAQGVYITRTADLNSDRTWPSITNIGTRPTFDGKQLTIETYLLSPLEGETPSEIRLGFLRRVRAEQKFGSPADLKQQILKDVGRAQSFFRRSDSWVGAESYTKN